MNLSPYFAELRASYEAEIDDLSSDSEGRSALKKRLQEKREQFSHLLPMIEFSAEMVAVAFYGAFSFSAPKMMRALLASEPDSYDFMVWDEIKDNLTIADWAQPLIGEAVDASGGDVFLVTAAALEYLRLHDGYAGAHSAPDAAPEQDDDEGERDEQDDDGSDSQHDLAESGSDWLSEQGFEALESEK